MIQSFGGSHTETKLDAVKRYLEMYTTALKKQNFHLVYFDAFAGTGTIEARTREASDKTKTPSLIEELGANFMDVEPLNPLIDGSAKRALDIKYPFDRYVFVEKNRNKAKQLHNLANRNAKLADRIDIRHSDANKQIEKFCKETRWEKIRAVMFLDPFGSQVKFSTIESIAKTEAIDLWYLFPAFLSVFRQISADGRMTKEQRESIERILGTVNWRETWIKTEVQKNLFGHQTVNSKQVEIDDITRFMISRMKTVFDGRVLDNWLPLGKDGAHWYSLLFAWANPGEKAKLAAKFANYVMTRS